MRGSNGLVGVVEHAGIAAIGDLDLTVEGEPGPSGYLVDITVLDRAMREHACERFSRAIEEEAATRKATDVLGLLGEIAEKLSAIMPAAVRSLRYRPNPFRSMSVEFKRPAGTDNERKPPMTSAILTETFEFAASHRLHIASLGDDENRRLFGKCNNPNGHGHNYRVVVAVEVDPSAPKVTFREIESIVQREIMDRFDHKHLNLDCPEFRDTNPSVENIARVCHDLLAQPFSVAGGKLAWVEVWETEKTGCRYPA